MQFREVQREVTAAVLAPSNSLELQILHHLDKIEGKLRGAIATPIEVTYPGKNENVKLIDFKPRI